VTIRLDGVVGLPLLSTSFLRGERHIDCFASHGKYDREGEMQIGVETSRAVENKRIFVIDDDEIIRAAVQFMLHDENETHEVQSLEAAFEKAVNQKPDLVVIAERLVRLAGLPALSEISQKIPGVKILVIIESLKDGFGKEALAAGAHGFIAKPLTIEFVRQKVDVLLGRRQGLAIPLKVLS
jgi:CheY-like chemotaxis protein